ncbi:hypothetical protein WDW89_03595 [Deltaproteobacteria bacterium TL4]
MNKNDAKPTYSSDKSRGMLIRELSRRIYQLLIAGSSKTGNNFHRVITVAENRHPQYTIDKIYRYLHKRYFYQMETEQKDAESAFLVFENGRFYLKSKTDLWEVLRLIGIHPNFHEIPLHLRQQSNMEMLENLVQAIPRSGILYKDRLQVDKFFIKSVNTETHASSHPEGTALPDGIAFVKIHRIIWEGNRSIKIWEILPKRISNPTPICLLHGFTGSYYHFHLEGNESIDYHLAQQGSRVFILDHDRKDNNANLDVYAEYLVTTLVDFAREKSHSKQVILGGHSIGGILSIIKTILDTLHRPRFVISIKALFLISPPLDFQKLRGNILIQMGKPLKMLAKKGLLPYAELFKLVQKVPFGMKLMQWDVPDFIDKFQDVMNITESPLLSKVAKLHEVLNPFSLDLKILKKTTSSAVKNPPYLLFEHIENMTDKGGNITSFQFDWPSGWIETDFEPEEKKAIEIKSKYAHINYSENFYRIPANIPILEIHGTHDTMSSPEQFEAVWSVWPHLHKTRLSYNPYDPAEKNQLLKEMTQALEQDGLSSSLALRLQRDVTWIR